MNSTTIALETDPPFQSNLSREHFMRTHSHPGVASALLVPGYYDYTPLGLIKHPV
ncbi:hypothetical protein CLV93_1123 [Prolixibacter denitrificans]|uniref:Uncharacterized protein n=1 Tax=Prolixibacter denitrificans TaxID=1541063 RepID=A0A2P8C7C7_9BACT|nr:hypothetical protein CLV93_1123 [Prolixibacter denitrificans]